MGSAPGPGYSPPVYIDDFPRGMVWDIRPSGDNRNGGGFREHPDCIVVDFSQRGDCYIDIQGSLRCVGVADELSTLYADGSVFDVELSGNVINIHDGISFNEGLYEIWGVSDNGSYVYVWGDVGEDGIAGSARVGGAWADPFTNFKKAIDSPSATHGHTFYVEKGTYIPTISTGFGTEDGTPTFPIHIHGWGDHRGDEPRGDDRPLLVNAGEQLIYGDYTDFRNFRLTGSHAGALLSAGQSSFICNCKVINSKYSSNINQNYDAIYMHNYQTVMDCECQARGGAAVGCANLTDLQVMGCYLHDSIAGIGYDDAGEVVSYNNVIHGCRSGIRDMDRGVHFGNTIIGCSRGISWTTFRQTILNNIIAHCNIAIYNGTPTSPIYAVMGYNCLYGNITDIQQRQDVDGADILTEAMMFHHYQVPPRFNSIDVLSGSGNLVVASGLTLSDPDADYGSVASSGDYVVCYGNYVANVPMLIVNHTKTTLTVDEFFRGTGASQYVPASGFAYTVVVGGKDFTLHSTSQLNDVGFRMTLPDDASGVYERPPTFTGSTFIAPLPWGYKS